MYLTIQYTIRNRLSRISDMAPVFDAIDFRSNVICREQTHMLKRAFSRPGYLPLRIYSYFRNLNEFFVSFISDRWRFCYEIRYVATNRRPTDVRGVFFDIRISSPLSAVRRLSSYAVHKDFRTVETPKIVCRRRQRQQRRRWRLRASAGRGAGAHICASPAARRTPPQTEQGVQTMVHCLSGRWRFS